MEKIDVIEDKIRNNVRLSKKEILAIIKENQLLINRNSDGMTTEQKIFSVELAKAMYLPLLNAKICHVRPMLGPAMYLFDANETVDAYTKSMSVMFNNLEGCNVKHIAEQLGLEILKEVVEDLRNNNASGDRYFYCPYVPIYINTFDGKKSVMTRYGKKLINKPFSLSRK